MKVLEEHKQQPKVCKTTNMQVGDIFVDRWNALYIRVANGIVNFSTGELTPEHHMNNVTCFTVYPKGTKLTIEV